MKKQVNIIMFIAIAMMLVGIVSCKGPNWTQADKKIFKEKKVTPEKFGVLQFANGPDGQEIELQRTAIEKEDTIINGKLVSHDVERNYIVRIKPFTLFKMVNYFNEKFEVACEADSLTLVFTADASGKYFLFVSNKKKPEVQYGNFTWTVVQGATAGLYFDYDQLKTVLENKRTAHGMNVREKAE